EWAIIHRCKICGALSSNRIAADDNPMKLMSIAMKPLATSPFPLEKIEEMTIAMGGDGDLKW
ncbi:RNHCP domain-containing protein, partial [Ruminococcus flavefaciens]